MTQTLEMTERAACDGTPQPTRGWTEIQPATGLLRGLDAREVWAFRHVALVLARRQFKARYKQTALGLGWVVIQPLVTLVVFSVIFGRVAGLPSDGLPYPVFLVTGLVLWNYISFSVQGATNRLVEDRDLVTKIYFPRLIAPLASMITPLIDLTVGLLITLALVAAYGVAPGAAIVLTPAWILGGVILACSVGMFLSAINVQYRDAGQVIGLALQMWLFVSPVVYSSAAIHGLARTVLSLNPLTGLLDGLRFSILNAPAPPAVDALSLCSGAVMAAVGLLYFQRVERRFAELV